MLVGITGAIVKKYKNCYKVIYKEHVIFESESREVAVLVALKKTDCENLLTDVLKSV